VPLKSDHGRLIADKDEQAQKTTCPFLWNLDRRHLFRRINYQVGVAQPLPRNNQSPFFDRMAWTNGRKAAAGSRKGLPPQGI